MKVRYLETCDKNFRNWFAILSEIFPVEVREYLKKYSKPISESVTTCFQISHLRLKILRYETSHKKSYRGNAKMN